MVSPSEGAAAVALARGAIATHLAEGKSGDAAERVDLSSLAPVFAERRGVFVTLKKWPGGGLRGCIGFPLPVFSLGFAVARAAVAAATDDPRFRELESSELDHVSVEVSVLTPPEALPRTGKAGMLAEVSVGRDGLIVDGRGASGLLLPQVAVEYEWDAETFLRETCRKAGLPPNAWEDPRVTVRRFRAEVFAEPRPGAPAEPDPQLKQGTG
jgi:hypothetical protein